MSDTKPKLFELEYFASTDGTLSVQIINRVQGRWQALIGHFRLPPHTKDAILQMRDFSPENACREVFRQWLDGGDELLSPKDWNTVIDVLRRLGNSTLADEVCSILTGASTDGEITTEGTSSPFTHQLSTTPSGLAPPIMGAKSESVATLSVINPGRNIRHPVATKSPPGGRVVKESPKVSTEEQHGASMSASQIQMPCLGRAFKLGMLYDCRTDQLIPDMTLWDAEVLYKACTEQSQPGLSFEVIAEDNIEGKAYHLGVEASLKLSLMSGLVSVSGAASYFHDQRSSNRVARVSLKYKCTSKFEQLGMELLGQIQNPHVLDSNIATHVVTGVLYGAEAFFVFDRSVTKEENVQDVLGKMEDSMKALPEFVDVNFQDADKMETDKFQCKFYGDLPLPENPSTFQHAVKVYQQLPKTLDGTNTPKSVPNKVWLYPLCQIDSRAQHIVREISVGLINSVQKLLEEIHELEMQSNDIGASDVYQQFKGLRKQMSKFRSELSGHKSNLVKKLSVLLPKIRRGGEEEAQLAKLLTENEASPFAPQQLSKWLEGKEQEKKLLSSYLARLKKSQFEFVPEDELDALQFDVENVVCFAFRVCGEDDCYLGVLSSYVRTGHQPPPASKSTPWHEDREVKQSMRRQLQIFEEFAKVNEAEDGIKFVVTDISRASFAGKNGAAIMLYNDGIPIEFEPPSQPGTPYVTKLFNDRVTLQWSKPLYGSDSITGYTVICRSTANLREQWRACKKTTGPAMSVTVDGLTPESSYSWKLRAECKAGFSPESEVSDPITTKPEPPSEPGTPHSTKVSHDSITIEWSKPTSGTKNIKSYTVLYQSTTDLGHRWTTHKTAGPQLSTTVSGLQPQTTYYFKVRAIFEGGSGPESDTSSPVTTKLQLPSQPGTPHITKASNNIITIEWSKPVRSATSITRYTVFYRSTTDQRDQWIPHTTIGPELSTTVSGLTPQTQYVFKVRTESEAGFSPDSGTSDPVTTTCELSNQPGTPVVTKIYHDNITIEWSKPDRCAVVTSYTIFYHSTTDGDKWMSQKTGNNLTCATVTSLTPETLYTFKVRAERDAGFSPDSGISELVKTPSSPENRVAVRVKESREHSRCLSTSTDPHPHNYVLVTKSVTRDKRRMIAKCIVGSPDPRAPGPERVLMVVGATGAGKTTLINGIANYILGVKWEDDFRFKLITDEGKKSQAESQTTWITAYTFHLRDNAHISYTLTVIDIPGFGDCEGLERDRQITEQIKHFINVPGESGIDQIHGVGFVVQGSLAQLTPTQRYIFDSILSIFGNDIADNIFMMMTFCDGSRPPVLDVMQEARIPHQQHFKFNNSSLYAKHESGGFDEMFWKLGVQSFGNFFGVFQNAQARSLALTREVLSEREKFENILQELHPQICAGLSKMEQLRQLTEIDERNKALIEQNKDFKYTITVPKSRRRDTELGQHVMNCLECNYTCHERCPYVNDKDKARCVAMRNGSCTVCPGRCHWTTHRLQSYWYEVYEEQETRTSVDLKRRYDTAIQGKSNAEAMIANMEEELKQVEDKILSMVSEIRRSLKRLDEIALKPNPLTVMEYIDLLIEGEKQEAKPGWMSRVQAYEQVKQRAKLMAPVQTQPLEKGSVFASLAGDGASSAELESSEAGHHQSRSNRSRIKSWWS